MKEHDMSTPFVGAKVGDVIYFSFRHATNQRAIYDAAKRAGWKAKVIHTHDGWDCNILEACDKPTHASTHADLKVAKTPLWEKLEIGDTKIGGRFVVAKTYPNPYNIQATLKRERGWTFSRQTVTVGGSPHFLFTRTA